MTREMIIKGLNNRGYRAEAQNTIKNGVEFKGIRILTESNVSPIIYVDAIIERAKKENKTLNEVIAAIITIYESNKDFIFDVNVLFKRDFIMNHIYIGLQKDSTEEIVKKPCALEGIESYLYVREEVDGDGNFSMKLTHQFLERANITETEAWKKAQSNTNEETSLESMAKVMADMMGYEYSEEMDEQTPFFVISNTCKIKGASAILNKKVLADFGKRYNTNKIVVLPSSIHEMILIPYEEDIDIESFSFMVEQVNDTQVDPTERLTNRAYILEL